MNKENNIINPNIHIQEYLENYLKLSNPEYAILLNGEWGSGKTYFIDTFINKYNDKSKKPNIKFIKISLFGLKNTNSIDEEIFQNLHPLLGSKYAKIAGNMLKSALKLGINIDWNQDGKKDGAVNINLKFNPLDFFSDKKKSEQEIVFIFDDLERTEINLKEVLGYINYLVEQLNFKVIILANEKKLNNNDYKEFKEKIIGKTFKVKHSFENVLTSFIKNQTNLSKEILHKNVHIINEIYYKAEYNNLRHISQILFDFEYFVKNINKEYLKCKDFVSILINNFFALSIELKSGNLTREELLKREIIVLKNLLDNKDNKETNIEKIYEKYNIKNNPLFDGKNWVEILLDNSIQKEELNKLISNLFFFVEKKEKVQPSWIKLWHYMELSDEEFNKNLNDVRDKFLNCKYDIPEHFIHVIALLIFFSKNQLCSLTVEDIKSQVKTCMEKKYQNHENWKNKLFEDSMRFNKTGLNYMHKDDEDFKEIFSFIKEENKIIYEKEEKNKKQQLLNKFLKSIKELNEEFLTDFLLNDLKPTPKFSYLNHKKFTEILTSLENKNISKLGEILHSRYSDYKNLNDKVYYCYLTEELDFWKSVSEDLDKYLENIKNKTLNTLLLDEFNILVKDIINKMNTCLESKNSSIK